MAPQTKAPPQGKKVKLHNSRAIRSEITEPGFRNGGLNVPDFIASREYEIKAFEQSQLNTKAASSTRVFQSLPRTLRRRTASHNVKRVPKRLRSKALREMQNTVNGTPEKKQHLRGRQLYKLKMQKRLLRIASRIKALRAVPQAQETKIKDRMKSLNKQLDELKKGKKSTLNNTVAAFDRCSVGSLAPRPTGNMKFGSRQKSFTWMPTHVWHAKRYHMTKRWGFQIPFSPNQKCFRSISRAAKESTIAFESSFYSELTIDLKDTEGVSLFLRNFTRYCDSLPQWLLCGEKVYNGWIYLNEQKVAPGVVLVNAHEHQILVRLHPNVYENFFEALVTWSAGKYAVVDCRYAIGSIELRGPTALNSLSKVIHVDASDEIFNTWRTYSQSRDPCLIPSGTMFSFFVRDPRFWKHPVRAPPVKTNLNDILLGKKSAIDADACKALFSLESRTRSYKDMYSIKQLGKEFARRDPLSNHIHAKNHFPVIIFKTSHESWSVLLPWFWVQPLWGKLISVKGVTTGGLRQTHQLNFEYHIPTYPQDFPYLPEGYKEHLMACTAAKLVREKIPLSKQQPLKHTEGVLMPESDWYFLWKWKFGVRHVKEQNGQSQATFGAFDEYKNRILRNHEDLMTAISATREQEKARIPITYFNKNNTDHMSFVSGEFTADINHFPPLPVVQVKITLSETGSIKDNARIYERVDSPTIKNLIGFVTSGAFNLNLGGPSGVGLVSADSKTLENVLIRNVGCTAFYKGKLSLLK